MITGREDDEASARRLDELDAIRRRVLAHAEGGEVGLERRGVAMVATVDLPS